MEKQKTVERLINMLLEADPGYRSQAESFPKDYTQQRYLLRCLMNVWDPRIELPEEFYTLQDELLSQETTEKIPVKPKSGVSLWQGDITRLQVDAIVNAANSQMLGCFVPGHNCIDNAIHSASGLELRQECYRIMSEQGHEEETGKAKITPGYNLPAKYVIHTVGPIVSGRLTDRHRALLRSSYQSCLELAEKYGLHSIAFCCLSTGVFRFPHDEAAKIAVDTIRHYLAANPDSGIDTVVFNVFKDEDRVIYENLLEEGSRRNDS